MKPDLSTVEARTEMVAQLTNKHFAQRLGALIRGDQDAVRNVGEALSHEFSRPDVMDQLIMLAVTDARQSGHKLNSLIEQVVRADAEVAANKEVEQLGGERARQEAEDRAEQDAFVRMVMGRGALPDPRFQERLGLLADGESAGTEQHPRNRF